MQSITLMGRQSMALLAVVTLLLSAPLAAQDLAEMYPDTRAMNSANKYVSKEDMEGAFKQYLSAATYGNKEAQKLVGLSYLDGSGVKQDNVMACAWLQLASTFGDLRVKSALNDLTAKLDDDALAKANKELGKLQKKYGDDAALKKRKKWVRKEIRSMSGSGAKRPSANSRVEVSLRPGRTTTITMGELQDTLDGYVEEFEAKMEKAG